jgi:signal transduction histidine kinase/ActR/RegA family two-component response regulator
MHLFAIAERLRAHRWFGYAIGVISVLASYGIRVALGDLALHFPFVIFLPSVVLTTFLGGLKPGIASAILAGVVADYSLINPVGTIALTWPDGWIAMAFYTLTVSIDIALISAMFAAFERARAAERSLIQLNEGLEDRIRDRTHALQRQIAEREEAEAQVRQLQKMESIGQLTGGIAHDFNNMLAVVIGSLQMARRRHDDPARVAKCVDSAEEAAKRAAQLTARLLAFSRQQPLAPEPLDANKLVSGMSEMLRRSLGEQVRIETVLSGGLWRTFADPVQVESALINLAVNARDAMPGGGRLTIETANVDLDDRYAKTHLDVEPGQYVMLSVTDTGTGMQEQVVRRAFDPFYTTKGLGKGTGLGLSQVYGFVKQSGGHVALYSEIDHGTTVKIYLPRYDGAIMAGTTTAASDETPNAAGDEIVLVVEDESAVRHVSVDALRDLGYAVVQASDGKQALEVLRIQPRVDILFTDIVMPEMTGRELAEKALILRPNLQVIYTTGYTRNSIIHNGILDPGIAFLAKPFTIAQLAQKMKEATDRRAKAHQTLP